MRGDTSPAGSAGSARLAYLVLLSATIALGLGVHFHAGWLPSAVRDVLSDSLWAAAIFWILALPAPGTGSRWLMTTSFAICLIVELSQLARPEWLSSVRNTTLGHIVLGSDFDPRDLLAYGGGVVAAALMDRLFVPKPCIVRPHRPFGQ